MGAKASLVQISMVAVASSMTVGSRHGPWATPPQIKRAPAWRAEVMRSRMASRAVAEIMGPTMVERSSGLPTLMVVAMYLRSRDLNSA